MSGDGRRGSRKSKSGHYSSELRTSTCTTEDYFWVKFVCQHSVLAVTYIRYSSTNDPHTHSHSNSLKIISNRKIFSNHNVWSLHYLRPQHEWKEWKNKQIWSRRLFEPIFTLQYIVNWILNISSVGFCHDELNCVFPLPYFWNYGCCLFRIFLHHILNWLMSANHVSHSNS